MERQYSECDVVDRNESSMGRNGNTPHDGTWRYFNDKTTVVDFVLAYKPQSRPCNNERRNMFQQKLTEAGLVMEIDDSQDDSHYVKINVPDKILKKYCEFMKMRMPMKELEGQDKIKHIDNPGTLEKMIPNCISKLFNDTETLQNGFKLLHEYSESRSYLFDEKSEDFFTPEIRICVVNFILERSSFEENTNHSACSSLNGDVNVDVLETSEEPKYVGIRQLLEEEDKDGEHAYYAVFPLHDGSDEQSEFKSQSLRAKLLHEWAPISKCMMPQPLDTIKQYFGVKVALYFAWIKIYTAMLIPASVVGLICFLYGFMTFPGNRISNEICSDSTTIMCPQCDKNCGYWHLNSTCLVSKTTYIFDNGGTIAFSLFISIWAPLYLKLWKRKLSRIQHRWGVLEYCSMAEPPRPEYLARVKNCKHKKYNVFTRIEEPSPSFWTQKVPTFICSYSVVYIFISVTVAAICGIFVYSMSLKTSQKFYWNSATVSGKLIIYPVMTATINLLASTVLAQLYNWVAKTMTDIEYRRTQSEYNNSLNLKLYLFEFINYYSSLFYIAFIKGKFPGYPKEYNRIFGIRQEECSTGGCLVELTIQLAIIMVGKQAIGTVKEILIPYLTQKYKVFCTSSGSSHESSQDPASRSQWVNDDKLLSWKELSLFKEYLKIVIQYGFITIFAVAFPPASLFALLHNVFETRVDARKFLQFYKRSVPERVRDLGMWYNVLLVITKMAVISNAFIIAFSSNMTHRLMYMVLVSPEHTDEGFVNHTLAYFDTSHFELTAKPDSPLFKNATVEVCRYSGYRNPPDGENAYERSLLYWKILAMRLALMVVYQNLVGVLQVLVSWAIPDMPRELQMQIKKEQYFINEYIIEQEKNRERKTTRAN